MSSSDKSSLSSALWVEADSSSPVASGSTLIQLAQQITSPLPVSVTESSPRWQPDTSRSAQSLGRRSRSSESSTSSSPLLPHSGVPVPNNRYAQVGGLRRHRGLRFKLQIKPPCPLSHLRYTYTAPPSRMKQKGGNQGPFWQHFAALDAKAHPEVKCLHCHALLKSAAPKRNVLSHALKCPELLPMDKHFLRSAYNVPVPSEQPVAIPP